jgi:hypothetical protein
MEAVERRTDGPGCKQLAAQRIGCRDVGLRRTLLHSEFDEGDRDFAQ